jgi:hypothetical protein
MRENERAGTSVPDSGGWGRGRINKRDLRSLEFGKRGGFIWDFGPHASPGFHGRKTRARAENHL